MTVGDVHRAQRAQVDDLGLDAVLRELVGGAQRIGHADAEGDDGHVAAGAGNAGLADRHQPIVDLRHIEGAAVKDLVLEEDHRVGIADRRFEQALGVGRGIGLRRP